MLPGRGWRIAVDGVWRRRVSGVVGVATASRRRRRRRLRTVARRRARLVDRGEGHGCGHAGSRSLGGAPGLVVFLGGRGWSWREAG